MQSLEMHSAITLNALCIHPKCTMHLPRMHYAIDLIEIDV